MSIIRLIDTPINTARSFFKIYNIQDKNLINNCIQEIKDKLHDSIERQVGFFSDIVKGDYNYGKLKVSTAKPLTPSLSTLLNIMNTKFNSDYNGILINYYKDGNSFIPLHSDSKNHPDNGVLIMGGSFQEDYLHDLKKEPHITKPRYSISFHKYINAGLYDNYKH